MRHFLADSVLRPNGYDVLTAANGDEGLTLAHDLLPDVIIADYQLPGRDALAMLRELRDHDIDIPTILITAEGSEQLAVEALRAGVRDYLIKPFGAEDLLDALERVLRLHWKRQIVARIPSQLLEANQQLEQRVQELDTLVKIGKRVTGQLNLQEVLHEVVSAAVRVAAAEEGSLLLVDHMSGELYLYASTEREIAADGNFRLPVSDSLAGRVIQTRKPLVITGDDLQKIKTHYFFRDLAYVPLMIKERAIGVLGVLNRETSTGFNAQALQLLSLLSDFAAIAIENARLYSATRQERNTLNTILRDTEDAIIVTDPQNNVLFCNPAARNIFGIDGETYQGRPITKVLDHEQVIDLFTNDLRSRHSRRSEIILDEGARTLNAQLTVVRGVGRVVVMQDITHLKELDRIKSEFVTTVSHDLRSPLTAILGYVEMVQRSGDLNQTQQAFLERIVFSVRSITTLISDLLELGKIEAGFDDERETVYLPPIIEHAIETSRHRWEDKQQDVRVELDTNVPPVLGNALRLRQLASNLIENAVKYTPEQGMVYVALTTDGEFVILQVQDTGIGIPAKDQPYIFDKFYRSEEAIDHYEGTGLGLSIVKSIVDAHNGRIWLDSKVGHGTTFTVMLPGYDPDAPRE